MAYLDRIGHESGEWFERYVEDVFRFAGFQTHRDRLFFKSVKHEIDVWAESEFATIAVECKDWKYLYPQNIKKEFDAFIAKVQQIGATTGVFAVNVPDTGQLTRYREYLSSNGLTLWDSKQVEKWHEDITRIKARSDYLKKLCDSVGVVIREPTKGEKAFSVLKGVGRLSLKGLKVTGRIVSDLADEPKPKRRRHRKSC
jgi:Restriction endonuclease